MNHTIKSPNAAADYVYVQTLSGQQPLASREPRYDEGDTVTVVLSTGEVLEAKVLSVDFNGHFDYHETKFKLVLNRVGAQLVWLNDDLGYRCPECYLYVAIPKRDVAFCPRCK